MYHEYTYEELRSYCRNSIESLELWARRLIHEKMSEKYGEDFIHHKTNGEPIIKKEIIKHVDEMQKKDTIKYKNAVDTFFIDEIVYFLCHPKFYKELFKEALDFVYPQGKDETRHFFKKLIEIRNSLSHANPISTHQAEQAICYSHDFIEGLKEYYKRMGEEQVWNVPRIIRINDSLGNVFEPEDSGFGWRFVDGIIELTCGDEYSLEVEIDNSFDKTDYSIEWTCFNKKNHFINKNHIKLTIDENDVAIHTTIECKIISKKTWHKFSYYDDCVIIRYTVLPPK